MQRAGKRKSLGSSQPLDSGILYNRVTDLSAVLLDGEAAAQPAAAAAVKSDKKGKKERKEKRQKVEAAAPAVAAAVAAAPTPAAPVANGDAAPAPASGQKQRKKARWTDEQKEAAKAERAEAKAAFKAAWKAKRLAASGKTPGTDEAPAGEAPAAVATPEGGEGLPSAAEEAPPAEAEGAKKSKKSKKAAVPATLAPQERVSGPGNAEEAQRMRQALGFAAPVQPVAAPAGKGMFSFGFAGEQAAAAAASPAPAAAPAAPAAAQAAAESEDEESSSSEEEESSSSEEEQESSSEEEQESSSDEEEESSSSEESESESDSDSDSDAEEAVKQNGQPAVVAAAAPAMAPAPAVVAAAKAQAASSGSDSDSSSSSDSDDDAGKQQQQRDEGDYVPRRVYVGGMPYGYTQDTIWGYWGECGEIEGLDLMTFPDTGRFRGIVFITFKTEDGYEAALACNGEQCDGQTLKVMRCRPSPKDRQQMQAARQQQQPQQAAAAPAPAQQYAPPARYAGEGGGAGQQAQQEGGGPPAWARAPAGQEEGRPAPYQRQQAELGGQEGAFAAASAPKRSHAGPAPKTPGYHVAYVGNVAYEADDKALTRLFEPCGVIKVRLHTDKDTGKPKGFAHVHFKEETGLDQAVRMDGTNLLGRSIRVGYAQPKKE